MDALARFRGCLLGLACGDAVGTTVEFQARGSFPPVTDMVGGGPFQLQPGQWTDDTSMALCLAASLIEKQGFDARDQMERYCAWQNEGYMSSTGRCFDIGITTSQALRRFQQSGDPFSGSTAPAAAGNGCIMRLAPVPLFFGRDGEQAVHWAGESSRTTHGTAECIDACRLLAAMLVRALRGESKEVVLFGHVFTPPLAATMAAVAEGGYRDKPADEIPSTGYVLHCLQAACWSFWHTDNFRDAILTAVNLGDDADTTGAVCGQLAGAFYGEPGIPSAWLDRLAMREMITSLAERLAELSQS